MMWVIVVMTTTVGYGDLAPRTNAGRLISIFAIIWGIMSFSLFIVTINNSFKLQGDDELIYETIVVDNEESEL